MRLVWRVMDYVVPVLLAAAALAVVFCSLYLLGPKFGSMSALLTGLSLVIVLAAVLGVFGLFVLPFLPLALPMWGVSLVPILLEAPPSPVRECLLALHGGIWFSLTAGNAFRWWMDREYIHHRRHDGVMRRFRVEYATYVRDAYRRFVALRPFFFGTAFATAGSGWLVSGLRYTKTLPATDLVLVGVTVGVYFAAMCFTSFVLLGGTASIHNWLEDRRDMRRNGKLCQLA